MTFSGFGCAAITPGLRGQRHLTERQGQSDRGQPGREEIHGRRADKARDKQIGGPFVKLLRGADLLCDAPVHHYHAIAQRHCLGLVVGDVDGGGTQPPLQLGNLAAHLDPQLRVQVRQRLVHQECFGMAHDCPAHRDPLSLTTRQL